MGRPTSPHSSIEIRLTEGSIARHPSPRRRDVRIVQPQTDQQGRLRWRSIALAPINLHGAEGQKTQSGLAGPFGKGLHVFQRLGTRILGIEIGTQARAPAIHSLHLLHVCPRPEGVAAALSLTDFHCVLIELLAETTALTSMRFLQRRSGTRQQQRKRNYDEDTSHSHPSPGPSDPDHPLIDRPCAQVKRGLPVAEIDRSR